MNTNVRVRWLAMLTIAVWLLVMEVGVYIAATFIYANAPAEIRLEEVK
jgi:hypothetical protein